MLTIWSDANPLKVYKTIQTAFTPYPKAPTLVVSDFSVPEGTTAILALGEACNAFLAQNGAVPKGRKIASLRGTPRAYAGVPVFISFHPNIGIRDHNQEVELALDATLALRFVMTGKYEPTLGAYRYVPHFTEAIEVINARYEATGKPVPVALDLETVGLDPLRLPNPKEKHPGAYIVTIQLTYEFGTADVVRFESRADEEENLAYLVGDQLRWLLTTGRITLWGANLKYDLGWIRRRAKIKCTNFTLDTTMIGSLLDENRANGLDVHAKLYVPRLAGYSDVFDRQVDKSRMDLVPAATLLPYAGGDTDATYETGHVFRKILIDGAAQPNTHPLATLANFYVNVLHPAGRAVEEIEHGGVLVDLEAMKELRADLIQEMEMITAKASRLIGGRIRAKHLKFSAPIPLNLMKASLISDYLFTPMGLNLKPQAWTAKSTPQNPRASTAMDDLKTYLKHPEAAPFVALLVDYSMASKVLTTYIDGFLDHLRSDNRYHPAYWLFVGDRFQGEGGTNCMPAGQLVLTNRGYLPVEQVAVGDQVMTHRGRPRKVIEAIENGSKPIYRTTMSNGLSLLTTSNHAFRIGEGWVEARDLVVGMEAWAHSGMEEWALIETWEDYEVSSWGRVRNVKTQNVLTLYPKGKWGHLKVCLSRNGAQVRGSNRKDTAVHKLVAKAFLGYSESPQVRHLNGYAWDNTVGNLTYGTELENKADAVAHGSMCRRDGTQNRLTEKAVAMIRSAGECWNNHQLAKYFRVSRELVRDVRLGKRWLPTNHPGKIVKFQPVIVVQVEPLGNAMTYGLTVEEDHSHVTGGLVTHNTGRLSCKQPAFQTIPARGKWAQRIRRCYICPPGYCMVGVDYSQGELRVVADIANDTNMLKVFAEGKDIHGMTAAPFKGYTYEDLVALKLTDEDLYEAIRQLGKAGNFGLCIAKGQRVLTDAGLVPIEQVQRHHRLWDGVEWVTHDGVISKGIQPVITYAGLTATEDHEVWCEDGRKISIGRAASEARRLVCTGSEARPIRLARPGAFESDVQERGQLPLYRRGVRPLSATETLCGRQSVGKEDHAVCMPAGPQVPDGWAGAAAGSSLRLYGAAVRTGNACVVEGLQGPRHQGAFQIAGRVCLLGVGEVAGYGFQTPGLRPHRQRWALRKGQSATGEPQEKSGQPIQKETFDILNAGPRHRFTCEDRLVSNCYGMGELGFQDYAFHNYGVMLSEDEVHAFREGFFETYAGLRPYHREYKKFARKHGWVRGPMGRVRHLPLIYSPDREVASKAERNAINSPVQMTLSDMLLWACAIEHDQGMWDTAPCFGLVHDAQYSYVPEETAHKVIPEMLDVMQNLPFEKVGWTPKVKFLADAKMGPNMGDMHKWKG